MKTSLLVFRVGVARLATLLSLLATVACSKPSATLTDDRAALDGATTRLLTGLRGDNPDSVLAVMTDDLVIMPPNEPVLNGKAAVRTWYERLLTQVRTRSLTITDREVQLNGDLATEVSAFEWVLAPVAGGPPIIDRGHYIQVWRREPDGRWLLNRELWNSATPDAVPPQ